MTFQRLKIPEVLLFEPRVFSDSRGYFLETWSEKLWDTTGINSSFVQDNLSRSTQHTLRGLHLQHPHGQAKFVYAITGTILDVAVDVRVGSPTFGQWIMEELSEENHRQLYIPPGFAHGFCVLSPTAHVAYKCTAAYHPASELSIHFADPELNIPWPNSQPLLSAKDAAAPTLTELLKSGRLPSYGDLS